jgi:hypothetical protein
MFLSRVALIAVLLCPLSVSAGQFGLKSPNPDKPFPGAYRVIPEQLPVCATCFAYWDLRFQFDEDGLDPDFPGEKRWAVAVQIGRHRGDAPGTMEIKLWDNQAGTAVMQDVAVANSTETVMVWFDQWGTQIDDALTFDIWWAAPGDVGSTHFQSYAFPLLPGTIFKRAVVQARLSSPAAFAGLVRLYEEGNNFRGWKAVKKQAGCSRDTSVRPNEFRVVCTPSQQVKTR